MIGGHRFARQGEALVVCTGTVAATAEHRCGVEEWTYGKHTLICSDSAAADFGAIATLVPAHDTGMRHVVVVGVVAAIERATVDARAVVPYVLWTHGQKLS
jgi:hypothetical protein